MTSTDLSASPVDNGTTTLNVADHYSDLLAFLSCRRQLGWIHRLSEGYYEGWRPTRSEVADLIAVDLGALSIDEVIERKAGRRAGKFIPSITPVLKERARVRDLRH